MKNKSALKTINIVLAVILAIVLVLDLILIIFDPFYKPVTEQAGGKTEVVDVAVIDEFVAGTYGGVEFASMEDVVDYYNAAYDKTKTETIEYIDDQGNTQVWYKLLGAESLAVSDVKVDGKENQIINTLIDELVPALYQPGLSGLSPSANRNPEMDVDSKGDSLQTSRLVVDDLLAANVKDNGDGTITITLQPKFVNISMKGLDAQRHEFTTLDDIGSVVEAIPGFSWATGTTEENCNVNYYGSTATAVIDVANGTVISGDYVMQAHIDIQHASIAVISDKSMTGLVTYTVQYPASAEYMMETKGVQVK